MQNTNQSLSKLKSIGKFLQISGKFYFINYNLKLFFDFINNDAEIGSIIKKLLSKYPSFEEDAQNALRHPNENVQTYRYKGKIKTFEAWVAFCMFYIKVGAEQSGGNSFIEKVIGLYDGSGYDKERNEVLQCFNDIVEPILLYVELQIEHTLNSLYILQRYKILCEWYERDLIRDKKETEITKDHLSKFLFDNGFTYSLSETTVPSGRIDNFAISIGIKERKELSNLPNAIIAEGKIYENDASIFDKVYNQVHKRVMELNFDEGYCVVFNRSNQNIILENVLLGGTNSLFYKKVKDSKIYFLIVNLHEDFYSSTKSLSELKVDTNKFTIKDDMKGKVGI